MPMSAKLPLLRPRKPIVAPTRSPSCKRSQAFSWRSLSAAEIEAERRLLTCASLLSAALRRASGLLQGDLEHHVTMRGAGVGRGADLHMAPRQYSYQDQESADPPRRAGARRCACRGLPFARLLADQITDDGSCQEFPH